MVARIKQWFADLNIQRKLTIMHTLIIVFALLPVFFILSGYEYYSMRQALMKEVKTQAMIISDNVLVAMAFDDDVSANESLATLHSSDQIVSACLVRPNGETLAIFQLNTQHVPDCSASDNNEQAEHITFNIYSLSHPLYFMDEYVGQLNIKATLRYFHEHMELSLTVLFATLLLGTMMAFILGANLKTTILDPLTLLMARVNKIRHEQDYTIDTRLDRQDEIGDLSHAFHKMVRDVKNRDEKLKELAFYDKVTGLPNRHYFSERLEQVVNSALRYQHTCCLMFIDLDDFKIVNDSLGHHVGDLVLERVAQRLNKLMRKTDFVCRIGGDEYAVIIEKVTSLSDLTTLADKIIDALSRPMMLDEHEVTVGASIGISTCPDLADTSTSLLQTADIAMYAVKAKSKNAYKVYESSCSLAS